MNTTKRAKVMRELFADCHKNAVNKGWWQGVVISEDDGEIHPLEVSNRIALTHGELSEGLEEVRKGRECYELYLKNEKPEGLVVELADTIIRIADLAGALGLDLAGAIEVKMAYNENRSYRHGDKVL